MPLDISEKDLELLETSKPLNGILVEVGIAQVIEGNLLHVNNRLCLLQVRLNLGTSIPTRQINIKRMSFVNFAFLTFKQVQLFLELPFLSKFVSK